ncbi:MAG: hypothetical protein AMXMBFR77_01160 [Phycisphaerales bacterium]|nr:hypothetical protein [Leptolyngbya sp.]MCZ7632187.1 MYXO-CTERM sorting domain-containing protein [Phycisphaerales bacterium]MDL1903812.1 hypothetical protein [Synechococcales cyanobacterium CNB]GIK18540.1 MAG: hypothetical protein BroJett004_07040 [Planctomycetota bacterium]
MRTHMMTSVLTITGLAFAAAANPHDGDFIVGVNGLGKLMIEADLDEAFYLPPFNAGGVVGWFGDDPGFASLDEDEPGEDFYTLKTGADVWFVLVAVDPAFKVYDPFFNLMSPGDSFWLGGHEFDVHPFWHIDSADPAFDPARTEWHATFRLIDLGGTGYGVSDDCRVAFTNVPTPGAGALLVLAGTAWVRRRR